VRDSGNAQALGNAGEFRGVGDFPTGIEQIVASVRMNGDAMVALVDAAEQRVTGACGSTTRPKM